MIRSLSEVLNEMGFTEKPQIKGDYNLARWLCDKFSFSYGEFVCWRVLANNNETLREYIENLRLSQGIK